MSKQRQYKNYSAEFKQEAVGLVTEQGYSVAEAASSLGIRTNLLYRWKQQIEAAKSGTGLSAEERVELHTLRKENKRLRMEKEILKKASAFFAKEVREYRLGIADEQRQHPDLT